MPPATRNRNYASRTPEQVGVDTHVALLANGWPAVTAPRTTSSRGIANVLTGNEQYVLVVLQALFHTPKFVAWVRTHNISPTHNPCRPNQVQPLRHDLPTPPHPTSIYTAGYTYVNIPCVACSMKVLLDYYWGNHDLNPRTGEPLHMFSDPNPPPIYRQALGNIISVGVWGMGAGKQDPMDFYNNLIQECVTSAALV